MYKRKVGIDDTWSNTIHVEEKDMPKHVEFSIDEIRYWYQEQGTARDKFTLNVERVENGYHVEYSGILLHTNNMLELWRRNQRNFVAIKKSKYWWVDAVIVNPSVRESNTGE
jgi:hypothetical protein